MTIKRHATACRAASPMKRTFKVSVADAVEGSLLRRLWAQKKLADLMIHQKANEKEIAALGKQFGLVTPYTSLLVLDSLEQYVQYEIAPPKSLAAMREEYMRRIDTVEHQKQKAEGRQAGRGRPHVGAEGEVVEHRVQVCQGFQVQGEQGGQGGVDGRGVPESLVPAQIAQAAHGWTTRRAGRAG